MAGKKKQQDAPPLLGAKQAPAPSLSRGGAADDSSPLLGTVEPPSGRPTLSGTVAAAKDRLLSAARETGLDLEQVAALLPAALDFVDKLHDSLYPDEEPPLPAPSPPPSKREMYEAAFAQRKPPRYTAEQRKASRDKRALAKLVTRDGITPAGVQAMRETHTRQLLFEGLRRGGSATAEAKHTGLSLWQVLQERRDRRERHDRRIRESSAPAPATRRQGKPGSTVKTVQMIEAEIQERRERHLAREYEAKKRAERGEPEREAAHMQRLLVAGPRTLSEMEREWVALKAQPGPKTAQEVKARQQALQAMRERLQQRRMQRRANREYEAQLKEAEQQRKERGTTLVEDSMRENYRPLESSDEPTPEEKKFERGKAWAQARRKAKGIKTVAEPAVKLTGQISYDPEMDRLVDIEQRKERVIDELKAKAKAKAEKKPAVKSAAAPAGKVSKAKGKTDAAT